MKNKRTYQSQVFFTSLLVAAFVLAALGISGTAVYAQEIPVTEVPPQPLVTAVPTQAPDNPVVTETGNDYVTFKSVMQGNGITLTAMGIHGPSSNPLGADAEAATVVNPDPASAVTLTVPTMKWVFGCSAVSAAMIAGYYDRNGYPNMYTGPTDSGVYPLTEAAAWGTWIDSNSDTYPNNPLIASHNGLDGRTTKGSIDDYWVYYGSSASDPYITGSWTQHSWGASVGDYMKTSQSIYTSTDGNTWFWNYGSNSKLQCSDMPSMASGIGSYTVAQADGTYGRKLFYEAKGYTVTDCYNQEVDGQYSGGFSLDNYKAQIDAGHPVLLNLAGHSIVGVGYDPSSSTIYIHDTWDNSTHTMVWNGSYSGMILKSVSIVNLNDPAPTPTVPTPKTPTGTVRDYTPTFTWTRITNATSYSFTVMHYSTTVYSQTVSNSNCGSSTTNCSYTPTTVLPDGNYTWLVRAYVGGVWGSYSSPLAFKVTTIPTTISPTGTVTDSTPPFTFTRVAHATLYRITVMHYSTTVYNKTLTTNDCGSSTTNCTYSPPTVLPNGNYTWKVRAYVGGVWKSYSPSLAFKVTAITVPTPKTPTGTVGDYTPPFTFTRLADATQYSLTVLHYSTTVYTKTFSKSSCGSSTTTCTYTPTNILPDGSYTWKVRAYIGGAWQSYSPSLAFKVTTVPTPSAPSGTITTKTPTFTFTRITHATQYSFTLYKGSTTVYSKTVANSSCGSSTTNCSYTPLNALSTGSYTWKVRAYVGGVWKSYSAAKSFTYATTTAFDSEFTTDASGWTALTGSWSVGSGYLQSAGLDYYNASVYHANTYSTITYQAKFKRNGCTTCANYLYINGTPTPYTSNSSYGWYKGYRFQYNNSGDISIFRYDSGVATAVLDWTTVSAVTTGWNTMVITYYPSNGYFTWKVNGVKVAYGSLNTYKSGRVGMGFYSDGTSTDHLYVDWAKLALTAPSASSSMMGEGGILINDSGITAGMTSGNPDKSK